MKSKKHEWKEIIVNLGRYFNKIKLVNVHLGANMKTWSHALKFDSNVTLGGWPGGSLEILMRARLQGDCFTFPNNPELSHMIKTYSRGKLGENGLPVCPGRNTKYNRIWWWYNNLCHTSFLMYNSTVNK